MKERGSGILLHITSLPSPYGIGDLGTSAYKFVDFLVDTKQSYWQILPLNPTRSEFGNSPYNGISVFAGNPLLISIDILVEEGVLLKSDLEEDNLFPADTVDYDRVTSHKEKILQFAYDNYKNNLSNDHEFESFCKENDFWLNDYALFISLREEFKGKTWGHWPVDIRDRSKIAMSGLKEKFRDKIIKQKFFQYIFFRQWLSLKEYCNVKKIKVIGDVPMYVNYESSDVWANPELFKLDKEKRKTLVSGVPPDYFSVVGQLWGNPVYNWDVLKATDYSWWINRIDHYLRMYDMLRFDHFRGFVAYWEVEAGRYTAMIGRWVEAPGKDFFTKLLRNFPKLPVIAEDLGIVTPDVRELMDCFGFPGMKLLIFAFGDDFPNGSYLPHTYSENCVVYTGTHDNNTIKGWFRTEATSEEKSRLFKYLRKEVDEDGVHLELIRLAMMSRADIAIIPIQDLLGLGEEATMNRPSRTEGNWQWRLLPSQIKPVIVETLKEKTEMSGRG